MRIRTVKPEFWQHEELATLPREVRMLAVALLNWSDDEGYFQAHPALIAGALIPFDADGKAFVEKSLPALARVDFVEVRGGIGRVLHFKDHQRINKPTKSRLSLKFEEFTEDSRRAPVVLPEDSHREVEVEVEVEVEQGSGKGSGSGGAAVASPVQQQPKPVPVPTPTTPGEEFWAWAQEARAAEGYVRERMPHGKSLSTFINDALMEINGDLDRLKEAWWVFGRDKHWAKASPPFPWDAFAKGWRKYVPKKAPEERGCFCARCGSPASANIGLDESPTWACYPCVGEFRVWSSQYEEPWTKAAAWAARPVLKAVAP